MYKLINDDNSNLIGVVNTNTLLSIPVDPDNKDYQEYLEWVAEGNTPQSPDQSNNWEAIRQKRDQLIRDSDWTMTPGATVDQAHGLRTVKSCATSRKLMEMRKMSSGQLFLLHQVLIQ